MIDRDINNYLQKEINMNQEKKWIVAICMALVLAAAGVTGYAIGRNSMSTEVEKERERNFRINHSELEGLGQIDGKIYVTGHKNPDSDTVGSAIAYTALLWELGYDAAPVVLGEINRESEYILKAAGVDKPMLLEDAAGLNMVLVDHSEYAQSADGLKDANIIGIIDHHGDGTVTTGNQLIYDARPLGSTATIIWIKYRDYGIEPSKKMALVMMGSILSDTFNLHPGSCTFADIEAVKELSGIAGVPDTDAFYAEMFKASVSYEGMTDEEIYFSDYKEYEAGGKKFAIGCIEAYDEEIAADFVKRMNETVPKAVKPGGVDMAYAQISIFHDDISVTYIVPANDASRDVIDAAFGDRAVFDGGAFRLEPGVSRKKELVPAITNVLESYPKE